MMDKIAVVCLESETFYKLLDTVIQRFKPAESLPGDKWISGPEAMRMMRIKRKAALQKMRDEGNIRFTQPEKKIILYDAGSIRAYLEDFVYEPFKQAASKNRKGLAAFFFFTFFFKNPASKTPLSTFLNEKQSSEVSCLEINES